MQLYSLLNCLTTNYMSALLELANTIKLRCYAHSIWSEYCGTAVAIDRMFTPNTCRVREFYSGVESAPGTNNKSHVSIVRTIKR